MIMYLAERPVLLIPIIALWIAAMCVRVRPGLWVALFGLICRAFEACVYLITGRARYNGTGNAIAQAALDDERAQAYLTAADWAWLADVAGWQPAIERTTVRTLTVPVSAETMHARLVDGLGGTWHTSLDGVHPNRTGSTQYRTAHTDVGSPFEWTPASNPYAVTQHEGSRGDIIERTYNR